MVRPVVWWPPAEPSPAEQAVIKAVRRAKLFVFLHLHRHELFDERFQAELAQAYVDSSKGQPPVPPTQLALATILQAYTGVSDDEVIEATVMDRRWQLVLDAFVAGPGDQAVTVAAARQVRDQDIDLTGAAPALRRGVAEDRRISVEDPDMRHGRKSRSVLSGGYKRHVLRDLDTGLVPVVGITPANLPEASVTDAIAADLDAAGRYLSELHIDRTYLSSALVRDRGPDLAIFCKAWRVRNTGGRFAKDQFTLDFAAGQLTCPAGVIMPFEPGRTVRFPKDTCAACPLRARCTTSSNGRSVSIHPDEALLAELRRRQHTPDGRAKLRERVAVEHALAHVGPWQGRRARYLGIRKNLFDLRRVAVVHNLHLIARQPVTDSYELAA